MDGGARKTPPPARPPNPSAGGAVERPETKRRGRDHSHLPDWPAFMSRETAAAYLDISADAFDRYIRPRLTTVKIGSLPRFSKAELHGQLEVGQDTAATTGDDGNPWDDPPCGSDST